MHITAIVTLIAWSTDGSAALLNAAENGPEGGGSDAYVIAAAGAPLTSFLLSSTFSPGNGSTPQSVPAKKCRAAASALGKRLAAAGFSGVAVKPAACSGGDRGAAVRVSPSVAAAVESSRLHGQGTLVEKAGVVVRMDESGVVLERPGEPATHYAHKGAPAPKAIAAALSPSGRLCVVLADDGDDSWFLYGAFAP